MDWLRGVEMDVWRVSGIVDSVLDVGVTIDNGFVVSGVCIFAVVS